MYFAGDLLKSEMTQLAKRGLEREFKFKASKSGGKGGQHVNKVMTKAEITFNIPASHILSAEEKELLKEKLAHKLSSTGNLRIAAETYRSQLKNREVATQRLFNLLERCLKAQKPRKDTMPTKDSVEKRYREKRITGEKKHSRKKIFPGSFEAE